MAMEFSVFCPAFVPYVSSVISELFPFNYSVTGSDNDRAIDVFCNYLPFSIHEYDSGLSLNGWKIPHGWLASSATISFDGHIVYDCLSSPLGCSYLSPSFSGKISKDVLIQHSAFRLDLPDAVVYDWSRLYRQGVLDWGLSVPWNIIYSLPSNDLDIVINTSFYPATMKVLDYFIQGQSDTEIIINAHNCHPYQANDDLSGCAVAIRLFQYLDQLPQLRYSYRLLIAPELYGPMFWLDEIGLKSKNILASILLKSVGNNSDLKIQTSFHAVSLIDIAASLAASMIFDYDVSKYNFRTYYGNDETVFESPGYCIPSTTLTRYPFTEYHTNFDTPELISEDKLSEVYLLLLKIIGIVETNIIAYDPPHGLFCLSHPDYQLYRSAVEPGISDAGTEATDKRWNLLMNCLPRLIDAEVSVAELAHKYQLPYDEVLEYVCSWSKKGLSKIKFANP